MDKALFNRLAQALFVLVLLAVLDTCVATFGPPRLYRTVLGRSIPVSGDLNRPPIVGARMGADPDPATVQEILAFRSDSPGLDLAFLELKGRVWRGELTASEQARAGEYTFTVTNAVSPGEDPEATYTVRLFADEASLRADLPSFAERRLGVRPVWIFIVTLPLALFMLFLSYLRSGREEEELQAQGIGAIYKLAKRRAGWEIIFGLGSVHGVHPGDRLQVLDKTMRPVGELTAIRVGMDGSHADLPPDADIGPGYYVALLERTPPGLDLEPPARS